MYSAVLSGVTKVELFSNKQHASHDAQSNQSSRAHRVSCPRLGGGVSCVEDFVANPYILRERPADARVRVALVAQVVRAAAEGFLAAGHHAVVAILQARVVRAGGRVVHATGDAVLLTAAVGAVIAREAALYARLVRGAAVRGAQPLVARGVVEALAVGL